MVINLTYKKNMKKIFLLTLVIVCSSLVLFADEQEFATITYKPSEKTARDFPVPELLLPKPHIGDGEFVRFFERRKQEAGFVPEWRDALVNREPNRLEEWFPSIAQLSTEQRAKYYALDEKTGYGDQLISYFPGDFVNFLKGKALALVLEDLLAAGYDADDDDSVRHGILQLFHIVVDVPGYEFTLPERGTLKLNFIEHDTNDVLDISINMVKRKLGMYYFEDAEEVYSLFTILDNVFGEVKGENRLGRELKIISLNGFNESSVKVIDLPRVEGAVMTHEVCIGEWAATAGWQWFGRPLGLYQSLTLGFVQP